MSSPSTQKITFEQLPIFPLPNTVLLPGQQLPLHIFEPRYRQMTQDILDGIGYVVITLIDENSNAESQQFSRVGTVGKLIAHQKLNDGRFNILLEGIVRVTLEEITSNKLYRQVSCKLFSEDQDQDILDNTDWIAVISMISLLQQFTKKQGSTVEFSMPTNETRSTTIFRATDRFVSEPKLRQGILEATTLKQRTILLTDRLTTIYADMLRSSPKPKTSR